MSTRVRASFAVFWLLATAPALAVAQTYVVVPNVLEDTEGNNGLKVPFNWPPSRFQQIFGADQFGALPPGPSELQEIAFRANANAAPFTATIADVEIRLSTTTTAGPDLLSSVYASNVGADDTLVHDGPLGFSSSNTGGGPRPFDLTIPLNPTFLYDPTQGNLLLDVRVIDATGGATIPFFDARSATGIDTRVYCGFLCDPGNASGDIDDGEMVVRFAFVPEPDGAALAAAALAALAARGRGRRRRVR